ncbi:hypothetical protein AWC16_20020 [Mycolicibacter longobardus]|uniref:Uncharacterized protein n=1 Tax=Mycolicibacter longobardus TaxID=1108812 RepID=A0A1X1YA89_9MYCO|nr:hypothetical protein AWC16_20020 [Mycolicibacter longobardus]
MDMRWPDLRFDGEGGSRRESWFWLSAAAAGERQPDLSRNFIATEFAEVGPIKRRHRAALIPVGESAIAGCE